MRLFVHTMQIHHVDWISRAHAHVPGCANCFFFNRRYIMDLGVLVCVRARLHTPNVHVHLHALRA